VAFRYLSTSWLEEARRRLEASPEFLAAAMAMEASMLNVITEAAGGSTVYLYYRFSKGVVQEVAVGTDEAIGKKPAELTSTGTYDTFKAINQGKLGVTAAVLSRKIRLSGNVGRALSLVKPINAMNLVLRNIPTEY